MHANLRKAVRVLAAGSMLLGGSIWLGAQNPETNQPTADQGENNTSDRDLMKKIRRSLMDDHSLSTNAHNVKVIAQNGKVTLKGPVESEEEKSTVESKATEIAGAGNVTSEITVKAGRAKKGS